MNEVHAHVQWVAPESPQAGAVPSRLDYRTLAIGWVALATVMRLAAVRNLSLGNGEASYASRARFLAWSYYDHPPLLAWLAAVAGLVSRTAEGVRMVPILCSAAFGLLFYRLAERFMAPRAAFLALLLVSAFPVFIITGFVLNPEAPLAPAWIGVLLVVESMRERDEPWRPLLAGLLLGVGFLAKYSALLLVPSILLYFAASPGSRRWLRRPSLYAGALLALVLALPVLLWNQAHGWPTLHLHFVERNHAAAPVLGENPFNDVVGSTAGTSVQAGLPSRAFRVFVGQCLSYSPLFAPLLAVGFYWTVRRARLTDDDRFLAIFGATALLPILVALVLTKDSEQHWTMMAMVPVVLAAARWIDERWDAARWLRGVVKAGFAVSALIFAVVNLHAHTTWIVRLLPADRYDPRVDIVNELVGWNEVRAAVDKAVAATPGPVALATTHYSLCGKLLFETDDRPEVYCPSPRKNEYDYVGRRHPPADATVLVLTSDIYPRLPDEVSDRDCTSVDTIEIKRREIPVAHYGLHACAPVHKPTGDVIGTR